MNRHFIFSEWSESLFMALSAIRGNKLRSALTLLGIVIGVFSIIAVTTAMRVLQNFVVTQLNSLGSNVFVVQKWPGFYVGSDWRKYWNRKDLTYDEALRLKDRATLSKNVGVEASVGGKIIRHVEKKTNPNVEVDGVTPDIFPSQNWDIADGRAITESDVETGAA